MSQKLRVEMRKSLDNNTAHKPRHEPNQQRGREAEVGGEVLSGRRGAGCMGRCRGGGRLGRERPPVWRSLLLCTTQARVGPPCTQSWGGWGQPCP